MTFTGDPGEQSPLANLTSGVQLQRPDQTSTTFLSFLFNRVTNNHLLYKCIRDHVQPTHVSSCVQCRSPYITQRVKNQMSHSGSTKEQVTGSSSSGGADEEHAACQSCRRRKLKCSRENPACSQCSRLGMIHHAAA